MLSSHVPAPEIVEKLGLIFKEHLPEGNPEGLPLFLLVHGRTGDANVMWFFSRAFAKHRAVTLAPQGFQNDQLGGFSWWLIPNDDPKAAARLLVQKPEILLAHERLEKFIAEAIAHYRVNPKKIIGIGFSQGGALLSSLSLRRPELFAGVALLASFVPKTMFTDEELISPAVKAGKEKLPPYLFANGTQDQIVTIDKAHASAEGLRSLGASVEFFEDDVGHKIGTSGLRGLGEWCSRIVGELP